MIRYYCNGCRKQKPPEELHRAVASVSSEPISKPDVRGVTGDRPYRSNLAGELCGDCVELLVAFVGGTGPRNEGLAVRREIEAVAS